MSADDLIAAGTIAGALLAILTLAAMLLKGVRWMLRTWRKLGDFLDDWQGQPPRPGVPGRPGVMQRLAAIEAQVHPNDGRSMWDKLSRVERATGADQEEQGGNHASA